MERETSITPAPHDGIFSSLNFGSLFADNIIEVCAPSATYVFNNRGAHMTVGSSVGVSSALGALTNSGTQQLQQRIAAKVVMDQMESEAAMAMKIVESSNPPSVGSRVDFRA